jgi:fructose-1,6-bisphosphatase II
VGEIREAGARIQLHTDGDVARIAHGHRPPQRGDVMMGQGGTPEAVLSAIAIRIMGGEMSASFDPPEAGREERHGRRRHGHSAHLHRG